MRNKNRSMLLQLLLAVLVLNTIVPFANDASTLQAQTNSAANSQHSATHAGDEDLRRACGEAVEELRAARKLLAAQGMQIDKLKELTALEKQITSGVKDLRNLDAEEKQMLRNALAAAERETAAIRAENIVLKRKKWTIWKATKAFVLGAAVGIVAAAVLAND